jgi:hypothetical protein
MENLSLTRSRPPLRWMVLEAKRHGLKIDDSRFRTRLDMHQRDAPRVKHKPVVPSFVSKVLRWLRLEQQTPPDSDGKSLDNRPINEDHSDDISIHESTQCFWPIFEFLPIRHLAYTDSTTTTNR